MSDANIHSTNRASCSASDDGFIDVIASSELEVGAQRVVTIKARRLLVCRTENGLHAMLDVCPHARQPLAGGAIVNNTIECPRHGACFDLRSGRPVNGVTTQVLKLLDVREVDGRIATKLPAPTGGYMAWNKS